MEEKSGVDRSDEPFSVGIPFPSGLLKGEAGLELVDESGAPVRVQTRALAHWPDSSLKWVLFDFKDSVRANSIRELTLCRNRSELLSKNAHRIEISENENHIHVNTHGGEFAVNKGEFRLFDSVRVDGNELLDGSGCRVILTDSRGETYRPVIEGLSFEARGPVRATLRLEGSFKSRGKHEFAGFTARISFFIESSLVRIEFTLHNYRAARHTGGLWDLGDEGAVYFNDLSVCTAIKPHRPPEVTWKTGPHEPRQVVENGRLVLYQDSSGGENWKSANHVNHNGRVPNTFKGYKVHLNGKFHGEGDRAEPVVALKNGKAGITASVQYFWQNCPKAVMTEGNRLIIGLFPTLYDDAFELQGGEQKTHTLYMGFGTKGTELPELEWVQEPLVPRAPTRWYAESKALPYLIPETEEDGTVAGLLIRSAIEGERSFFELREVIDEYGWRNFGDFYADHESVGRASDTPLISHYNNQYDSIHGALIQFLRTGNTRWFLLAGQLCSHVIDIDIYHTDNDRSEYNHGMFWHTEHYLDVQTATHRCFSEKHSPFRDLSAYGGGPSLSHVYTSGLLLHYYMTGSRASQEAVGELANFVCSNIISDKLVISRIVGLVARMKVALKEAFGKTKLVELNKVYALDGPGRASGNALNVLLDAYRSTADGAFLADSEALIRDCIAPEDRIEDRDLLDMENRWMYTVFLQSLGKYLDIKAEAGQFDDMWGYAKRSLIHYARWMAENEAPYLDSPEKLEYPNETWAAQEYRKCCVFYYACRYSEPELRDLFFEKGACFSEVADRYLSAFETSSLTRPIALLMQNSMMHWYFRHKGVAAVVCEHEEGTVGDGPKRVSEAGRWVASMRSFSLKREIEYLRWRVGLIP